ncbi:alpha/beta-hydrolase [Cubamyces sp. BRFM 1775]|nr:alpha/beta-hydrolase [Cubamyces sp. BRFM 1775]
MDPTLYKNVTVPRGFTYRHYHSPAAPGKPTLLFLHSFPTSSYEWHRQIEHFQPQGYGIFAPDYLGAGESSKADDIEAYTFVALAHDIVHLLDAAQVDNVVGIGHAWGSVVLSRLCSLYPEKLRGCVWLGLGHTPVFSGINDLARAIASENGDVPGYWSWFAEEDAYLACEKNIDSFIQLIYPVKLELWDEWLMPEGKTKEWIEGNRQSERPQWLTEEEYNTMRDILVRSGLKSRNIYYGNAFSNANNESDSKIPQEAMAVQRPALFIAATRDVVCLASVGKLAMARYAPHAKVVEIDVGHWLQFEASDQVNQEVGIWLNTLL